MGVPGGPAAVCDVVPFFVAFFFISITGTGGRRRMRALLFFKLCQESHDGEGVDGGGTHLVVDVRETWEAGWSHR